MPAVVRTSRDRLTRTEPFQVFTCPQRSWPARLLGLAIRLRAEAVTSDAADALDRAHREAMRDRDRRVSGP